ncbi:transposase [Clostridium sp. CTA-1]
MILSKINREILWLLKGIQPKYRVIADFRKDNAEALHNVFESFVDLCIKLGLYGKELIAVDGTKIEASASKRKHYSKNKLSKMKERIKNKINEYMDDLDKNDFIEESEDIKLNKEKLEKSIEFLKKKKVSYEELEKKLEVDSIEILTDKGYFHIIYKSINKTI